MDAPPILTVFAKPELFASLDAENSVSLLGVIARGAADQERTDAAWKVFYSRHGDWLWDKCRRVAHDLGGDTWVEDIFLDTMEAVYRHAGTFHGPEGLSAKRVEAHLLAWLGKIANTSLRKRLESRYNEKTMEEAEWAKLNPAVQKQDDSEPESAPAPRHQAFYEAFDALDEREQIVLRVTFQYHRFGSDFQRLPNKVVKDLTAQLGTTPEHLRTIRKRALDKLRARFPDAAALKP